jgi:hypothetical protein
VGREQDAAQQPQLSQSSRRDAQQRGASGAPRDDDYPGLSRITLNQAERFGSQHGRKSPSIFRIISELFGSAPACQSPVSDHFGS